MQQFRINSQVIEDKYNSLLPSQGGQGSGVDLSASTMVIPIIDLTESAEGSNVRADIQTAFSHANITSFQVQNATNTVLVNNTGYFRCFGIFPGIASGSASFNLFDGSTSKNIIQFFAGSGGGLSPTYDFVVFIPAGGSFRATASTDVALSGCTRQIADINGTLVTPV